MYDHLSPITGMARQGLRLEAPGSDFPLWLALNADGLADLAHWLGGPLWRDRAERVCAAARTGRVRPAPVRELLDLFALTHVGDPDRCETDRFAYIDPGDPRVHQCCLVAESLARGLAATARAAGDATVAAGSSSLGRAA